MKKYLSILAIFVILCGCGEEEKKAEIEVKVDTAPPADVPIAHSDANISIDQNFPPMPVAE